MKKQTLKSSILTVFLLILLVAALAISMISCDKKGSETPETSVDSSSEAVGTELGEGSIRFTFKVKFKDESEKTYLISTDNENLGETLIDLGLISGEEGPYGLYVKTVDGETLDYDTDKKYWALYENDGYAVKGVESTVINPDVVYSFRAAS